MAYFDELLSSPQAVLSEENTSLRQQSSLIRLSLAKATHTHSGKNILYPHAHKYLEYYITSARIYSVHIKYQNIPGKPILIPYIGYQIIFIR